MFSLRSDGYEVFPRRGFSPLTSVFFIDDHFGVIKKIRSRGMQVGIAISPDTSCQVITEELGNAVDMILVMTVYPGTVTSAYYSYLHTKVLSVQVKAAKRSNQNAFTKSQKSDGGSLRRISKSTVVLLLILSRVALMQVRTV